MFKKFALLVLFPVFLLTGCGSGSNGSITLTLTATDQTAGTYRVRADAICTSAQSTVLSNVPVTITAVLTGGITRTDTYNLNTDQAGSVTQDMFIGQVAQPIRVDVTAATGGLRATQSVTIPAL